DQAADATLDTRDGTTQAKATVGLRATPATQVSFYQALAACEKAGKRLCTVEEWERACRGPESFVYPYGDTVDAKACNGFYNDVTIPLVTGSLDMCGSAYGVYDLSGNVAEWTASATERIPGSGIFNDRAVRGGSYQANAAGLRCVGDEYHNPPTTVRADLGFRCCL
ncbi:MAG: SUMF1/EgtB/PvdO family nonheme iron enzyme, partial [Clostridia bacterium]|nr:SUMF1/EgtB/PvdO family nonheme iron enzyme [Deltaproteobacteria bacterium]